MIVFLIGFMGSGKSTTGKRLAQRLGYSFLDTDQQIVEQFGMTVNEIFDQQGENAFRQMETKLIEELALEDKIVVSTGGGLPCHGSNMETMNNTGITVYLKADSDALYYRLKHRKFKRPLIRKLSDNELKSYIEQKLTEREPWYEQAKITVSAMDVKLNLYELVRQF